MNILTEIAITATVVTLGKWADNKPITPKYAVAGGFVIIGLFLIQGISEELANAMGALILFTSVLVYGPPLVKKVGLV